MARRHSSTSSTSSYIAVAVFVGLICGFLVGTWSRNLIVMCTWGPGGQICCGPRAKADYPFEGEKPVEDSPDVVDVSLERIGVQVPKRKNLVFIGVMTARKFINSRIVSCYQTWAKTIPGKVVFFSSEGSELDAPPGVPVVGLRGVDDTYPPQKKSFLMIKYMHDHYINEYEWFIRADDDVYIKGDKLELFLNSVNSSKPQFMGQSGQGTKSEFGKLSLEKDQNFCMGGPGIVFSRITLQKMVPHVSYCLRNLYTTHEDVEVGRCVTRFAGVTCTWAFEMQQIFYQNYLDPQGSFQHSLKIKQVHKAMTLHPIKNHTHQFKLHSYFHSRKSYNDRHKILLLQREIVSMNELLNEEVEPTQYGLSPSLMKFKPTKRRDVISWDFISKYLYSAKSGNPKKGLEPNIKNALNDIMTQVMQIINRNARQRGRTIDFKEILYGYKRINPKYGADYILDLLLVYRKHKGRRLTVPVRRHAYIQQSYLEAEVREITDSDKPVTNTVVPSTSIISPTSSGFLARMQNRINQFSHFYLSDLENKNAVRKVGVEGHLQTEEKVIHFILPLSGRFEVLQRFMTNFEEVCLKHDSKVVLIIVLFKSELDDRTLETINYIGEFKTKYPLHTMRVLHADGQFSRGKALAQGASLFSDDTLLFFIDVDIVFNSDALQRVHSNCIRGKQVYFPIVFSQFDPETYCANNSSCPDISSPFFFTQDNGYWRQFGYGIVIMYKSDYLSVGGLDTRIQGWGKEDIDLFEKFLNSSVKLFRAVDPGMVHIFHAIHCDPNLESAQYQMCLGTKASSYGSSGSLSKIVHQFKDIASRGQGPNSFLDNEIVPEVSQEEEKARRKR